MASLDSVQLSVSFFPCSLQIAQLDCTSNDKTPVSEARDFRFWAQTVGDLGDCLPLRTYVSIRHAMCKIVFKL